MYLTRSSFSPCAGVFSFIFRMTAKKPCTFKTDHLRATNKNYKFMTKFWKKYKLFSCGIHHTFKSKFNFRTGLLTSYICLCIYIHSILNTTQWIITLTSINFARYLETKWSLVKIRWDISLKRLRTLCNSRHHFSWCPYHDQPASAPLNFRLISLDYLKLHFPIPWVSLDRFLLGHDDHLETWHRRLKLFRHAAAGAAWIYEDYVYLKELQTLLWELPKLSWPWLGHKWWNFWTP